MSDLVNPIPFAETLVHDDLDAESMRTPPYAPSKIGESDSTVRISEGHPITLGPQIPLDAVEQLGPYRLLDQLGAGGMGIVFEVEDLATGEHFALKVLRPTLAAEPEAKQRFFREARAMAAVGHQRIIPVIRVGEDRGIPYIAMPLLVGETLEARLQHGPDLTLEEIIRIGAEIAEGLEAAHQQGLIHRDVKPANVWLEDPTGTVRLLDLGLARGLKDDGTLTNTGIVMGTPSFMSPEQARGEEIDARADLFSLGCILYQMATGSRPFAAPSPMAILAQLESYHPSRPIAKNSSIPTLLSNLIMELLAKQAKNRPNSAADVVERLRRIPLCNMPLAAAPADDWREPGVSRAIDRWEVEEGSNLPILVLLFISIGTLIWFFGVR
jgi:serine/threonine protein kinase